MNWYIYHCGERANRAYAEIFEYPQQFPSSPRKEQIYGPYPTKEKAIKAAERRGLTPRSLAQPEKQW